MGLASFGGLPILTLLIFLVFKDSESGRLSLDAALCVTERLEFPIAPICRAPLALAEHRLRGLRGVAFSRFGESASQAASQSRPMAGPVVSTRQPPTTAAASTAVSTRACWRAQELGSVRSHQPSSTMFSRE